MVRFGWFASLEEFSPAECLRQVELAEESGFETAWINDHFHPWFDHIVYQNHSPDQEAFCEML